MTRIHETPLLETMESAEFTWSILSSFGIKPEHIETNAKYTQKLIRLESRYALQQDEKKALRNKKKALKRLATSIAAYYKLPVPPTKKHRLPCAKPRTTNECRTEQCEPPDGARSLSGDHFVQGAPSSRTFQESSSENVACSMSRSSQERASRKRKLSVESCATENSGDHQDENTPLKNAVRRAKCLKKAGAEHFLEHFLSMMPLQSAKVFGQHAMTNPYGLTLAQEAGLQLLRTQYLNQYLVTNAMNSSVHMNNLAIQAYVNGTRSSFSRNPNPNFGIASLSVAFPPLNTNRTTQPRYDDFQFQ